MIDVLSREVTILWVEDVPRSIRANLRELRRRGFDVEVVETLEDSEKMLRVREFDLLFVDYSIPKTREDLATTNAAVGFGLIEAIREGEFGRKNQDAKIVLCTAQRESIGTRTSDIHSFGVSVIPKTSSYFDTIEIAEEVRELKNYG